MSGSDSPTFFHGQPWSSWIERIGRDKPLSDEETESQPSSSVTRLSVEDIDLYGFCPERDTFYAVVCEICNAIVKPQALIQHIESRHPSGTANFPPPPTPTAKPSMKTPYCKLSKLKKTHTSSSISSSSVSSTLSLSSSSSSSSSSSTSTASSSISVAGTKLNHTSVKRTVDQTNLSVGGTLSISSSPRSPLETIPVQTSTIPCNVAGPSNITIASTSGGSPGKSPGISGSGNSSGHTRRKRLKTDRSLLKDREYDPDRHCGVWNEETGKPCTRSLTCKAHTVSLRRTVVGRSKTFDKLLAEHRAAKEQPNSGNSSRQTTKMTVPGAINSSVSSSLNNPHAPNTPVSIVEPEAPSSPPVLSLPDTYPLPKAVDLLYRCLAPHGSTKPTKLEDDFANAEELRSLESTLVVNSTIAGGSVSQQQQQHQQHQQQSSSMMTPISVMLPSLSPLPGMNSEESTIATLVPSTTTSAMPIVPAPLPATSVQPPTVVTTVLEGETPLDIDTDMNMYSPVYSAAKDAKLMQIQPRPNNHSQSSVTSRSYQQIQASMPNLFEPMEQLEQQHASQINGKKLNHTNPMSSLRHKRHKLQHIDLSSCQPSQDFSTSTSIQMEATATSSSTSSSSYSHFGDISWSNCHPEPLAVNRWLRISSSRKQYNFNIH